MQCLYKIRKLIGNMLKHFESEKKNTSKCWYTGTSYGFRVGNKIIDQ